MYYEMLAGELLNIKAKLLQVPASQQISKINKGAFFVLNYLNEHNKAVHPKELSEKLAVSTARIATLLKYMEEKKLIKRTEDPDDNRQVIVKITAEGSRIINEIRKEAIFYISDMLKSLGPDDAKNYIRIQEKIYSSFMSKN